jgi:hypothetical protein
VQPNGTQKPAEPQIVPLNAPTPGSPEGLQSWSVVQGSLQVPAWHVERTSLVCDTQSVSVMHTVGEHTMVVVLHE